MFKLKDYFFLNETDDIPTGGGGGSLMDDVDDIVNNDNKDNDDPEIYGKPEDKSNKNKDEENKSDKDNNTDRPSWLPEEFENIEQYTEKFNSLKAAQTDAPEKYEFETPENFALVDGIENDINGFMEIAKSENMSQESFNKIMDFYFDSERQKADSDLEMRNTEAVAMFGGEDVSKDRIATMTAKAKSTFDAETYDLLKIAASNSPQSSGAAMRFAENVLNKFTGEPQQGADNGFRTDKGNHKTRDELMDIMKTEKYKKGDEATRKMVSDGFAILNNGK